MLSYFECACIDGPLKPEHITQELIDDLSLYLNDEYTATTITGGQGKKSREVMTSEVIYSYMVAGNVPFECDKWNIRRLMALLNVVSAHSNPPKKMSSAEIYKQNKALNDARKAKYNTKG